MRPDPEMVRYEVTRRDGWQLAFNGRIRPGLRRAGEGSERWLRAEREALLLINWGSLARAVEEWARKCDPSAPLPEGVANVRINSFGVVTHINRIPFAEISSGIGMWTYEIVGFDGEWLERRPVKPPWLTKDMFVQ